MQHLGETVWQCLPSPLLTDNVMLPSSSSSFHLRSRKDIGENTYWCFLLCVKGLYEQNKVAEDVNTVDVSSLCFHTVNKVHLRPLWMTSVWRYRFSPAWTKFPVTEPSVVFQTMCWSLLLVPWRGNHPSSVSLAHWRWRLSSASKRLGIHFFI